MILVAMLAAPGASAQSTDVPALWVAKSKLDLPIAVPLMKPGADANELDYAGVGVRFGGPASGWDVFGNAAEATLFSLAIINAFMPRWLPKGMSRTLNGTGGRSPSDVGVDEY
jgi:hypothetical protein